ncbi:MAG: RNA polymerase sigma factor [Lachnospiraceae bacterium]
MDTDFLLIHRMKKGDEKAFAVFIKKYYSEILRYCTYHCHDIHYAEDLTQETFSHFFRKLSNYQHIGKVKNFLYTIAGNLCKDYYRSKRVIHLADLPELHSEEDQVQRGNNKILVEWALAKLPEELREVVVLHYFQGFTYKEIAKILKIGEPLVKYRIKRAKEILRELCGEEDAGK